MNGQQPDDDGGMRSDSDGASAHFEPLGPDDPTTVAGYRLGARLGAGGMGKVYLSHTPGGRPVAIKVIRPEFAEDPEFRRRFAQEIRSAQRVQGLYTAPVIDADTDGPHPWLATAYVPGPSLAAAVSAHGPLPVETVLLLVAGIAEALQVIHGAGIVHRDLKPSNVLLASDGPRVIDFGIAHAADATSLTGSGVFVGTPAFMAPEQAAGRGVGPATDVFALGQVAAYAAVGAPPFGEGPSHGVLYRIVHEEPELSGVPSRLSELVTRCLAKDPADRPSVAEVIALCQTANDATTLRRPEDWLPAAVTAEITARSAAPAPDLTPPPPTHPPTAMATAPGGAAYAPTAPSTARPPAAAPTGPHTGAHTAPQAAATSGPLTPPAGQQAYPPVSPYAATQFGGPQPGPQAVQPLPHPQAHQNPGYPPLPFQPQSAPAPQGRKRGPAVVAAALVLAVVGGTAVYGLVKDKAKDSGATSSASGGTGSGGTADGGTGGGEGTKGDGAKGSKPSAGNTRPDPAPADYKSVNLTAGYHLTLGEDPLRPQKGEDGGYELSYDTGGYLDTESRGGSMVLLDPGQEGSLATCRAETRFTENVYVNKLGTGRQICVTTGTGHLALVTVRGMSPEDSPSTYLTLDMTVWRNGAVGSGSR
ncbi:serine/threonine-protein kinase [Streptomyces sp. TN58]|uniref:serine/threonine-protein kinase n=1 Tax=Streptomyces sp. TN58 TaxID=234612 RepID=UPI0009509C2C|nr:serine/threonine protein kinase [Streptomyces sp. TN58]